MWSKPRISRSLKRELMKLRKKISADSRTYSRSTNCMKTALHLRTKVTTHSIAGCLLVSGNWSRRQQRDMKNTNLILLFDRSRSLLMISRHGTCDGLGIGSKKKGRTSAQRSQHCATYFA